MLTWLGEWNAGLQTASLIVGLFGVVAGLIFNGLSYRANTRETRIQNLFSRTAAHREVWHVIFQKPELKRAQEANLATDVAPTFEETIWIRSIILMCEADFLAGKYGMSMTETGLGRDIRQFFSKPIPRMIWTSVKEYLEPDFVAYIEAALK